MQIVIHHTSAGNSFRSAIRVTGPGAVQRLKARRAAQAALRAEGLDPHALTIFQFDFTDHQTALAAIFNATNTYGEIDADVWAAIEPNLHPKRATTALSVGDTVTVEGAIYSVEPFGFARTNPDRP
jgi:hypothetical protein